MGKIKKILYINKGTLHDYPPCISQITMLSELGYQVLVITDFCDSKTCELLEKIGVKIDVISDLKIRRTILEKIKRFIIFCKKIKKYLNEMDYDQLVWIGREPGIIFKNFLKNRKYVLTFLELYERGFFRSYFSCKCIKGAEALIACEKNRARIMQMMYDLKKLPYVMPNKPHYEMGCKKTAGIDSFLEKINGKKCVLYQGVLTSERPLGVFAEALNKTKEKYTFVIIGKGNNQKADEQYIDKLRSIYSDIIFGGYFPAPQHLYITEKVHIGIAIYDSSSLNTIFCAPNKTFEYAKFGVPILGSDIPGLQLTIEKHNAGICVDISDSNKIAKAIDDINDNYEKYHLGAKAFYDSVDNRKVMKEIMNKLDCE